MNLEQNKIFAAVLIAGIAAYLFGFASNIIFHEDALAENAYVIDVPEVAVAGRPVIAAGPAAIDDLLATVDIEKGKTLARACAACHTFDKGGANGVGPNLWNIAGKSIASDSSFAYSDPLKAKSGTWSVEELNQFLYKPKKYIPGTKMNYIGIKKDAKRAAVVAYLQSLK